MPIESHGYRTIFDQNCVVVTSVRNRMLCFDTAPALRAVLTKVGIERDRVAGGDASKVDDTLEVVELSESTHYEKN